MKDWVPFLIGHIYLGIVWRHFKDVRTFGMQCYVHFFVRSASCSICSLAWRLVFLLIGKLNCSFFEIQLSLNNSWTPLTLPSCFNYFRIYTKWTSWCKREPSVISSRFINSWWIVCASPSWFRWRHYSLIIIGQIRLSWRIKFQLFILLNKVYWFAIQMHCVQPHFFLHNLFHHSEPRMFLVFKVHEMLCWNLIQRTLCTVAFDHWRVMISRICIFFPEQRTSSCKHNL